MNFPLSDYHLYIVHFCSNESAANNHFRKQMYILRLDFYSPIISCVERVKPIDNGNE